MKRTFTILSLLLSIITISLFEPGALAQTTQQIAKGNAHHCAQMCADTVKYCTKKAGKYGEATVTSTLQECIASCNAASDSIARGSSYQKKFATIAIEASTACAQTCESFKGDKTMESCANECRKTASNLQKVVSSTM